MCLLKEMDLMHQHQAMLYQFLKVPLTFWNGFISNWTAYNAKTRHAFVMYAIPDIFIIIFYHL